MSPGEYSNKCATVISGCGSTGGQNNGLNPLQVVIPVSSVCDIKKQNSTLSVLSIYSSSGEKVSHYPLLEIQRICNCLLKLNIMSFVVQTASLYT